MQQRTSRRRKAKPDNPQPFKLPATGFVRLAQLVPGVLPFSAATLWRMVRAKTFPAPVKLSTNITAWRAEDVRAWLDEKGKQHQEPESQAA